MALKTPREAAITYPTEYVKTQLQLQSTHGLLGEMEPDSTPFRPFRVWKLNLLDVWGRCASISCLYLSPLARKSNPEYNGIIDCAKKTMEQHGVKGPGRVHA